MTKQVEVRFEHANPAGLRASIPAFVAQPWFAPALLTVLALAVRLATLPFWRGLATIGDEDYYWRFALELGRSERPSVNFFLRPPLWGWLLAGVARFTADPFFGRLLSALLGAVATPFIYWLGLRLFSRRAAVIAAVIYALYPNYVGYSHYLWAETACTLLGVVAACLFVEAFRGGVRPWLLLLFSAFTGLALLAKESAAVPFLAAMFVALGISFARKPLRMACAAAIFLAPVFVYSLWASHAAGRTVFLSDAPFYNANQVLHGQKPWDISVEDNRRMFADDLKEKLAKLPRNYPKHLARLWSPNSFVAIRLLAKDPAKGYGIPGSRRLANGVAVAYVALMFLGLTGLLFAAPSHFRSFTLWNLALLSLTPAIFLMTSRFRLPFMYLLILYAAAFIGDPRSVLRRPTRPAIWIAWGLTIALFAVVVVARWKLIGRWG